MKTIWGEQLDETKILPEYPRPQMKRKSFLNLNGPWAFYMGPAEEKPDRLPDSILVPFSPESELSGIRRRKERGDILCYRRVFTLPEGFLQDVGDPGWRESSRRICARAAFTRDFTVPTGTRSASAASA